jgi:hypothetical protein
MKIKNNIILKSNRSMFSGSGLHKKGLGIDVREYLKNSHDETIVNDPIYGRILGSKNSADNVKIGSINDSKNSHEDTHNNLVDQFKKISFKDKKKKGIKFEI